MFLLQKCFQVFNVGVIEDDITSKCVLTSPYQILDYYQGTRASVVNCFLPSRWLLTTFQRKSNETLLPFQLFNRRFIQTKLFFLYSILAEHLCDLHSHSFSFLFVFFFLFSFCREQNLACWNMFGENTIKKKQFKFKRVFVQIVSQTLE